MFVKQTQESGGGFVWLNPRAVQEVDSTGIAKFVVYGGADDCTCEENFLERTAFASSNWNTMVC